MEQSKFVVEGEVNIGPRYYIFVDGRVLGRMLIEHFRPKKVGDFHRLGHSRITIELLEKE